MTDSLAKRAVKAAMLAVGAASIVTMSTVPASAAKTHWTHATRLKEHCPIYQNYPKSSVPSRARTLDAGHRVGVRYTYKGYAMVLVYSTGEWGLVSKRCLRNPHAYSKGDHGSPLPDQRAIGGKKDTHGQPIVVEVKMSAPHVGKHRRTALRVGSRGTLRNQPASFVIGNARKNDTFYISGARCGHHAPTSWILGQLPASGRWGYLEAQHLPACL